MKRILLLMAFLPFVAHAQTASPDGQAKKIINILTLGDSNGTFPYSWPQQLKTAIPEAEVFNISKSGKTVGFVNNGDSSLNALLTIEKDLKKAADYIGSRKFDYIVMELGTNDAKAVFADQQDQVAINYNKLISKIKNSAYLSISTAMIILISPPSYGSKAEAQAKYTGGRARVEKMASEFKKTAKKNKCFFVDGFHAPGLDMETMSADGLHMNAEGSKKLIVPVVALIKNNKRVKAAP